MKTILTHALLLSMLAVFGAAMAQEQVVNPSMPLAAQANTGVGTVNRVDMPNGKVNLTHGPIKSLGWPGMTMDFMVSDRSLLKGIHPGEKVEFDVVKRGPGQFYIVRIKPVK